MSSTRVTPQQRTQATALDRGRQVAVTAAEVFCVLGTLVGTGVIGTRVAESSGGALAADATHLAPAGPAFSIWSVIYLGLVAYTVFQWLPGQAAAERMRRTGWLAAVSMVLNATWLLVTQAGWIWVSVGVIIALAVTLGLLIRRLQELPHRSVADLVIVDGTFGLYLGWVAVATVANITAAAVASGIRFSDTTTQIVALVVLIVVAGLSVLLAFTLGARWTVAMASAWGLVWIAIGRLSDEPRSSSVAVAALAAAVVTLTSVVAARRLRSGH